MKHHLHNLDGKMFHVKQDSFTSIEFCRIFSTSDAVVSNLKELEKILLTWNENMNLISKSTSSCIWWRHIADSAQIFKFFPNKSKVLIDLGSGAGFPGLVLSIMGFPEVHLVESVGKKANFLKHIIDTLNLNAYVHNLRIEELKPLKVDIVTSRALASLDKLLHLSGKFIGDKTLQFYFKGHRYNKELEEAKKKWAIDFKSYKSFTNTTSRIIEIKKAKRIGT